MLSLAVRESLSSHVGFGVRVLLSGTKCLKVLHEAVCVLLFCMQKTAFQTWAISMF